MKKFLATVRVRHADTSRGYTRLTPGARVGMSALGQKQTYAPQ